MPEIRFFGGKLNNRKKNLPQWNTEYRNDYIQLLSGNFDFKGVQIEMQNSYTKMTEIYRLTRVGYMIHDRYITRIGYVKVGSKVKPETIWKRGSFYSVHKYIDGHLI